ncbi:hypothetical protein BGZ47_009876 [Haplosporangium gracile]|nr:hypothetical protein BGZ47_009876 [Haplosporangium gracile]
MADIFYLAMTVQEEISLQHMRLFLAIGLSARLTMLSIRSHLPSNRHGLGVLVRPVGSLERLQDCRLFILDINAGFIYKAEDIRAALVRYPCLPRLHY